MIECMVFQECLILKCIYHHNMLCVDMYSIYRYPSHSFQCGETNERTEEVVIITGTLPQHTSIKGGYDQTQLPR